jgi:hypothetical protein
MRAGVASKLAIIFRFFALWVALYAFLLVMGRRPSGKKYGLLVGVFVARFILEVVVVRILLHRSANLWGEHVPDFMVRILAVQSIEALILIFRAAMGIRAQQRKPIQRFSVAFLAAAR